MTRTAPAIELIVDVKQSSTEFKHVIIGTFNFDAVFFERRLLPIVRDRDAENILVLMDKREYEQKFTDMKGAGKDYYVDYCRCGQIFHPKFNLFIWSSGAKLLIGSANMTDDAWMTSGELVLNVEFNAEKYDRFSAEIMVQIRDYLLRVIEKGLLRSTKHKQKIVEAMKDLSSLISQAGNDLSIAEREVGSNCKILHNLDDPIFYQLQREIGNERLSRAIVLAPFFDPQGRIIEKLLELHCGEIYILVQKDKVMGFPQEKIKKSKQAGKKIRVFAINFREANEQKRYIHAKIIILQGRRRSFCLFGSANPTTAALFSTVDTGNAELCVLRKEKSPHYFEYLLHPIKLKEIHPDEVAPAVNQDPIGPKNNAGIVLTDARLEKNNLVIEFEPALVYSRAKLLLSHLDGVPKELNIGAPVMDSAANSKITVQLDTDTFSYCSSPTYVSIAVQTTNGEMFSDKRWISTQALETALRRRTIDEIEQCNGRYGLIEYLNQLEEHFQAEDWFLYYLQAIDFENLGHSLEYMRTKLPKLKSAEEDEEEQEIIAFEERPDIDVRQVMKRIISRHQEKLHESIANIKFDRNFQVVFGDIFNLFMFVNKIILWFVFSGRAGIEELRRVRDNIEKFADFASRSLLNSYRRNFIEPQLSKLQFWEHLVILSCIIHRSHRNSGYSRDMKNQGTIQVFTDTYLKAISGWNRSEYTSKDMESLHKSLLEYRELKILDLKPDDITYFCDLIKRIAA